MEQLSGLLAAQHQQILNQVSKTVSTQIKEFEENFRASNTELAQAVVRESASDPYVFKRKGNKFQSDFNKKVFNKQEQALTVLKSKQYEKAQQELGENTQFIAKHEKVIKLDDKSEFGWETVNEDLDDGLTSDDEDSKRKRQRGELPKKLRDVQFYETERSLKCQLIILISLKLILTTSSKIPASLLRAQNVSYSRTNPINDICYKCGKHGHWAKHCKE